MHREIVFLLIGLVLLWSPRSLLRLGKPAKKRTKTKVTGGTVKDRMPSDHSLWVEEEFRRGRNWMDFGRAVAGGLAVSLTLPVLLTETVAVPGVSVKNVIFLTEAVVLITAVLIQMLRFESKLVLFPPVFFILGLAFTVVGPKAALIGFMAIWAINLVLPNPAMFLAVYAVGIAVLGVFFGSGMKPSVVMAVLAMMPPAISILSRKRLVQFRKKIKIASR